MTPLEVQNLNSSLGKIRWNIVPLSEVVFFQEGPGLRKWQWTATGMKVINVTNIIGDGRIDTSNTSRYISLQEYEKSYRHFSINSGDIVVASSGNTYGKVGRINDKDLPLMMNTSVIRFRSLDNSKLNDDFLYGFLRSDLFRNQVESFVIGSAQPNFGPTHLKLMALPLPPINIQNRIGYILTAYDELIENNQRRIEILEDMARSLYREWFVHFRYPGYESVPLIDSPLGPIPQGWEIRNLKDVCSLTMGSSPKSEFYNEDGEGLPFHQGVTNFGDRFPTDRLFCTVETRKAEPGDILFSVRAPVGRMNIAARRIVIGRGLSAIRHKQGHQAFLWEQLRYKFSKDDMIGNGSIFASVTKDEMEKIELLCPSETIIESAAQIFKPIHRQIEVLSNQVINLRRTRDLLLPRLLSGQIYLNAIQP
jgi:type I restriction enzyme, S subunit